MRRFSTLLLFSIALLGPAAVCSASIDTSGSLWYTTFAGGVNVHRVDYSWVGGSLTFSNNVGLAAVNGADGIVFLPNGNLAIGGQGGGVHEVTPTGAFVTTLAVPTASFHLSLSPGGSVLYSAGIPGPPTAITLSGGGLTGASTATPAMAGSTGVLDTIAFVTSGPNAGKAYYTNSGSGGFGSVGSVTFSLGPENAASTLTTTSLASLEASHGMAYDPFSDSIITMGGDEIARFTSAGVFIESLSFPGNNFDQGTVDGQGHIFAASNGGFMTMIDYSASGTLSAGSTTFDTEFLANALDDVAPKVGPGSNTGTVPEPTMLVVWSLLGMFGMACKCRGRR